MASYLQRVVNGGGYIDREYAAGSGRMWSELVILQAADKIEALRLKPARLFVVRRGRVIAETAPAVSRVRLGDREVEVTFTRG